VYVVWKKRELKGGWCRGCGSEGRKVHSLIPLLVESRRVNGKPRQVHLARLPSIRSCCLHSAKARADWWRLANEALRHFEERTADSVRRKLGDKVPPPPGHGRRHEKREEIHPPGTLRQAAQVLGLLWPATRSEVKAAFRPLAMKHHPDKGGNPAEFRRVYAAYVVALEFARAG
jgi:hypothetical protein